MTNSFFTQFSERCSGTPFPDNSLASIKAFHGVGETNFSISVQVNHEDELLVFHSEKLEDETNASGFSHYLSLADIGSVTYNHSQEKISTLKDVIEFFLSDDTDARFNLCIEMRGNNVTRALSNFLDGYIEHIGDEKRLNVIVASENHLELSKLGQYSPNLYLLAIVHGMPVNFDYMRQLQHAGIDGVKLLGDFVFDHLIDDIKARDMKVFVGGVKPNQGTTLGVKTHGVFIEQ